MAKNPKHLRVIFSSCSLDFKGFTRCPFPLHNIEHHENVGKSKNYNIRIESESQDTQRNIIVLTSDQGILRPFVDFARISVSDNETLCTASQARDAIGWLYLICLVVL